LQVLRELGERHEKAYLKFLEEQKGLVIANLSRMDAKGGKNEDALLAETRRLMAEGAAVIAQGALGNEQWFGRPDILLRVEKPRGGRAWSYEVQDTKLTKETKATTILQLSLYSELLAAAQHGDAPEFLWVIPGRRDFLGEQYRVAEYAAYYRYVKQRLLDAVARSEAETYPEPVPHCDVCRWFRECDAARRSDDHLSLVAGIRRQQRDQLVAWDVATMAKLAEMPIPLAQRPRHGSRDGMERAREQARVQVEGRTEQRLKHEAILPVAIGAGYCRLPEPASGDVFLDLEGDPFVGEYGLQYLFGFAYRNAAGELSYEKRWALTMEEEKRGFEWLIDEVTRRWSADAKMHVYHFGAYEPSALKRLMGMYATREDEVDRMLRAGVMVDLHQAFKQGTRASVEEYSLKKIEAFYGFARKTPPEESRAAMRYIEHRLELGWGDEELPDEMRASMEGYNAEDCFSTAGLRDWLEGERARLLASGESIPRPVAGDPEPSKELDERQKRVAALIESLTAQVPVDMNERNEEQQARWLLAQLLDWYRREDKATYWENFRLKVLDEQQLLDERVGLSGLTFKRRLRLESKIPVDCYGFERQETEVRAGDDVYCRGDKFGSVVEMDWSTRTITIKKTRKTAEQHPAGIYAWDRPFKVAEQEGALCRIGDWVVANGIDVPGRYRAGRDLLLRRPPRLRDGEQLTQLASEIPANTASRIVLALDESIFAIQGPPGSGKTYTGARMICELVKRGKKIGVTALSHKVIRKLLDDVVAAAREQDVANLRCLHKHREGEESDGVAVALGENEEAWGALISGKANVVGGVSWLWAPVEAFECVDVLFIDEAGQMSLADVLAVSQAAKKIVLLGDPQQLERPTKGSHPDGAGKSALEHLLNGRKTIAEDMGFLLPESWRLHPEICKFTSQLFYEGKLGSHALARPRILQGHEWAKGAGLWFVPVEHEGNQNSSAEEVEVVARIVEGLLKPNVKWYRSEGNVTILQAKDILIVAPYNAQVADLSERLPGMKIGTVDKFQGQQAPVVIYSMTTSSAEDAPRGMEFLYSLNRLNVATSRAQTAVILVGSPRLFEPECRSPRQMQLANALCLYRELATEVRI
jgi:uncharacterized protein